MLPPLSLIRLGGFFTFFCKIFFVIKKLFRYLVNKQIQIKTTTMSKQEKIKQLIADLGWDYDRLSSCGQSVYNEICDLLDIGSDEKLTFKAREGREIFFFEAFNEEEARESCDMWNATFIGQVDEKGNLLKLA